MVNAGIANFAGLNAGIYIKRGIGIKTRDSGVIVKLPITRFILHYAAEGGRKNTIFDIISIPLFKNHYNPAFG